MPKSIQGQKADQSPGGTFIIMARSEPPKWPSLCSEGLSLFLFKTGVEILHKREFGVPSIQGTRFRAVATRSASVPTGQPEEVLRTKLSRPHQDRVGWGDALPGHSSLTLQALSNKQGPKLTVPT